jgi:hypothetical protein
MLAWLLCRNGLVDGDVAVHSNVGDGGLSEREGEETINIKQTIVTQARHDNTQCRVCPNVCLHSTDKGESHPGKYSRFRTFVRQLTGGGRLQVRVFRGITRICG